MTQINIMALRHSAFYSPLLMTVAGGFLREQGLDANYTLPESGQVIAEEILAGRCHLAQSAVATGFAGLECGEHSDLVHFARINSRDGFFIAGRKPEPDFKWQNLIGKQVLVDHFFQPFAMFEYALHKQDIEISTLDVIDAGDVQSIEQAFRDGRGDYVHMQGPAPQQLEKDGIAYVVASVGEAIGPVAFSSLCARRDWLKTDMAAAFMRAYQKAQDYVLDAPAAEIASRESAAGFFPGVDLDVLTTTISAYKQMACWSRESVIDKSEYNALLDVFTYAGLIRQRYDYEELIVTPLL